MHAGFKVGDWQVFPDRHELRRGDEVRRIPRRLVALLLYLGQAQGRTVTREELLDAVWQRRMVNDEVLSRAIADLRRALDDDARQPTLVETLPKLGYRLLVPVQPLDVLEQHPGPGEGVGVATEASEAARPSLVWRLIAPAAATVVVALMLVGWWLVHRQSSELFAVRPSSADFVRFQPLVSESGVNVMPRFSPQADLFAYSRLADDRSHARVHVRSRDRRVDRVVGNDGEWDLCPLFSRDGQDLLWTRHHAGECRVMRMALAGGEPQVLDSCLGDTQSCPDLSPDGRTLVFSRVVDGGLVALGMDDGVRRSITAPDRQVDSDADPRWSPDGRRIAFLRGRSSDRRLLVLDVVAGNDPTEVAMPPARMYGIAWLDDRAVIAATDSEGVRALVLVDVDSGHRDLLGGHGARRPDRAPDGALAWEVASYRANLLRLDDAGTRILTDHRRSDGHQVLSPDGARLAFQSNREGPDGIWLLDLASGEQQRLPLPTTMRWFYPAWLPDGSGLLLVGQLGEVATAWRYRFSEAAPEQLDAVGDRIHGVQQDDDAGLWYLRDDDHGQPQLWRLPANASQARRISGGGVQVFRLHRNGVYFQRPQSDRLWRCNQSGEDCRETALRLSSPTPATWALSDETLFYQQPLADGVVGIMRAALTGDVAPEKTSWTMPSMMSNGLAVTRDGGTAYVTRATLEHVEIAWLPPAARAAD